MTGTQRRVGAPKHVLPFLVQIEGPGFRLANRYATENEAYTEARRIRDERTRHPDQNVVFRTEFGHSGLYAVGRVTILRWNPLTRKWTSHAHGWSRLHPHPNAFVPLPRDWHDDPLPDDWYADPADGKG